MFKEIVRAARCALSLQELNLPRRAFFCFNLIAVFSMLCIFKTFPIRSRNNFSAYLKRLDQVFRPERIPARGWKSGDFT